jgi:hypothetical protein
MLPRHITTKASGMSEIKGGEHPLKTHKPLRILVVDDALMTGRFANLWFLLFLLFLLPIPAKRRAHP